MMRFLNRLFNIRTHEWPRVLLLFALAILTNAVIIWGTTTSYAAFLKLAGLQVLPWVLVSSSVLSIVAAAAYAAFADRVANDKLLMAIYATGVVSIAVGLALLWLDLPRIAYPVLYLFSLAWTVAFNSHFTTYVNGFYDIQSAKRVLPVVFAGFRAGAIVAGLTMPLLTARVAPITIMAVWFLVYIVVMGLVWLIPYLLKTDKPESYLPAHPLQPQAAGSEGRRLSYIGSVKEGFRYVAESAYLRSIAIGSFLSMVLLALIEYRSSGLLLEIYGTQEELASFIALLIGVGNVFVLPMLLFGISRLIARMGLGNASLIFPAGNLIACGGLAVIPAQAAGSLRLVAASTAYLDRTAFRVAFQAPVDNLFYNAVPLRVRGRARAFVAGLIVPIGSLAGALLLLLPQASAVRWFMPALIGVLAVAYLISALIVRQQYGKALVEMLEQEDYSFLLSQEVSDLTVADPATLAKLQEKFEASTSHEITVFMAKLISQVGGDKAITILGPAARAAEDARTRSAIVDVIVASDLRGDAVYQLYTDLLADPDGQVRQSAIAGLEALSGSRDGQFVAQMLEMVQDPVTDVRIRTLSVLIRSGAFHRSPVAVEALDRLLADKDPEQRAHGVRLLGQLGESATHRLVEFLGDAEDRVRLEAAVAVEERSRGGLPDDVSALILKKMSSLLRDPVERVRQVTLAVLGRVGTGESYAFLVDALTDPSPSIRETAVDALARAGKSAIPIVHPKLDSSDPQSRKMATVVLSRVDPREFGGLILGSTVTGNLLTIYRNLGLVHALAPCSEYPSVGVLQSALGERNQQLLDEIFYLLTAIHSSDDVRIVRESLRSEDARVRANATEALESLTTPQMDDLIAPLFEPDLPLDHLLSIGKEVWNMEPPDTGRAIRQLVTDSGMPWLRAVTVFALGEMGASLVAKEERRPIEPERAARKARRISPLDILAEKLEDESDAAEPKEEVRRVRRLSSADLFSALDDSSEKAPAQPSEGVDEAQTPSNGQVPFALTEIEEMLEAALVDPVNEVRLAAQAAKRVMAGFRIDSAAREEEIVLSTLEKIIFLKEVPFFQGMTIDQLKVLANVCEEEFFEKDTRIYDMGDPGGVLYVVINGRVGIEQEKRTGSFARLADVEAHSYFGEMNLFDNSPRSTSAIAVKDTLTLRLRREPLIALARQHPDLSLELINVLSQRLRETSDRIAELTRTRPRELHKLFDQFD